MKRLVLKAERLAELTDAELQAAVGGTYSASTCVISTQYPCLTHYCTKLELRCIVDV